MTLDLNKPICTRDGRKAVILYIDYHRKEYGGYKYPIQAEVTHPNDPNAVVRWSYMLNGQWKSNDSCNHNDLINEMPWHRLLRETVAKTVKTS